MTNQSRAQQRWLGLLIAEWTHGQGEDGIIYHLSDVYVQVRGSHFSQPMYVLSEQCQRFRLFRFCRTKMEIAI